MDPVIVRNVAIGEGLPKICVPIIETTKEAVIKAAENMRAVPADLVEWRADRFEDVMDAEKVKEVLASLRKALCETPLLFTFRTEDEGGERAITAERYIALNKAVIESGQADLIDIQMLAGAEDVIAYAHRHGVKAVASSHDFYRTPAREEIVARLRKMQELGADIVKIAVMPQSKRDVLALLAATEEMSRNYDKTPVVTISMGKEGAVSRLCGGAFGSAITFGMAEKASAPGQVHAEDLKAALGILHKIKG